MRRQAFTIALGLTVYLTAPHLVDAASEVKLTELQGSEIRSKIERIPGTDTRVGTVSGIIDAPINRVWEVVSQYDLYKEFMPHFAESLILENDLPSSLLEAEKIKRNEETLRAYSLQSLPGDTFLFYNRLSLPLPLGDKRYILKMMRNPAAFSEHWFQVTGDMKVNQGSWVLHALGDQTLAVYTTYSDPGMPLPGFVLNLAMKSTLPDIIKAVRRRVQEQNR